MLGKRGLTVLAILLSVIGIGTAGYHIIEQFSLIDSLYMTMITISNLRRTKKGTNILGITQYPNYKRSKH